MNNDHTTPSRAEHPDTQRLALALIEATIRDDEEGQHYLIPEDDNEATWAHLAALTLAAQTAPTAPPTAHMTETYPDSCAMLAAEIMGDRAFILAHLASLDPVGALGQTCALAAALARDAATQHGVSADDWCKAQRSILDREANR